jgi:hypothetical protein
MIADLELLGCRHLIQSYFNFFRIFKTREYVLQNWWIFILENFVLHINTYFVTNTQFIFQLFKNP